MVYVLVAVSRELFHSSITTTIVLVVSNHYC